MMPSACVRACAARQLRRTAGAERDSAAASVARGGSAQAAQRARAPSSQWGSGARGGDRAALCVHVGTAVQLYEESTERWVIYHVKLNCNVYYF